MSDNIRICYGCMKHLQSGESCSCGWTYDYTGEEQENMLPPGTVLKNGNYRLGRRIGQGGFGITYIGEQMNQLGLRVAIKEYFPKKLAYRNANVSFELIPRLNVSMTDFDRTNLLERFKRGRDNFIDEAKRLAGFNELPTIVSVLDYFEENNTAYIVMEYINGIDLYHFMQKMGRTMNLAEINTYIYPIMQDLVKVHEAGVIHRDISPDNIMVSQSGAVKLIDFGAAVDHDTEDVKVLKKNGFAPLEQYDTAGNGLGPWTDVYALCATIYMLLSGKVIPDARDRQYFDRYKTLRSQSIMVPKKMDAVLKKGLAVDYNLNP